MPSNSSTVSCRNSPPALLFAGVLYSDKARCRLALEKMQDIFGPLLFESLPLPWHTSHYREELGWPITRRFVFFRDMVGQDTLADIKQRTISIEKELSEHGNRTVNLDPGYLTQAKVVLASTKDYAHRIYLREGIFAETTLYFRKGTFRGHLFTYRDFLEDNIIELFSGARSFLGTSQADDGEV